MHTEMDEHGLSMDHLSVVVTPDAEFGLHLYDESGETPTESRTGRRVMLRRPLQGGFPPSPKPLSQPSHGKPVLLAHRIRPGKTIQLKSSPNKATISEGSPLVTQPESVAMSGTQGPRYAASGCVPYSLLGTPQVCIGVRAPSEHGNSACTACMVRTCHGLCSCCPACRRSTRR